MRRRSPSGAAWVRRHSEATPTPATPPETRRQSCSSTRLNPVTTAPHARPTGPLRSAKPTDVPRTLSHGPAARPARSTPKAPQRQGLAERPRAPTRRRLHGLKARLRILRQKLVRCVPTLAGESLALTFALITCGPARDSALHASYSSLSWPPRTPPRTSPRSLTLTCTVTTSPRSTRSRPSSTSYTPSASSNVSRRLS